MEKFFNSSTFGTLPLKAVRWLGPVKPTGFYSPPMHAPAGPGSGPRTPLQFTRVIGVHELLVPELSLSGWLCSSQKTKHEVAGQTQTLTLQMWHATAAQYRALLLILRARNITWELPVLLPWTSQGKFEDFWQQIEGIRLSAAGSAQDSCTDAAQTEGKVLTAFPPRLLPITQCHFKGQVCTFQRQCCRIRNFPKIIPFQGSS